MLRAVQSERCVPVWRPEHQPDRFRATLMLAHLMLLRMMIDMQLLRFFQRRFVWKSIGYESTQPGKKRRSGTVADE
jgi:hypothetical protein